MNNLTELKQYVSEKIGEIEIKRNKVHKKFTLSEKHSEDKATHLRLLCVYNKEIESYQDIQEKLEAITNN